MANEKDVGFIVFDRGHPLEEWAEALGTSPIELERAIAAVGTRIDDVQVFLLRQYAGGSQR